MITKTEQLSDSKKQFAINDSLREFDVFSYPEPSVAVGLKRLLAVLPILLLAACQPDSHLSTIPPVDELATMIPVAVGSYQLHLPLVAITWAGRSKVSRPREDKEPRRLCSVPVETLVQAANQGTAIAASSLEILLDDYSTFKNTKLDRWFDIPQLCEQLTQRWARQQCTGPSLFQDNLRRFNLIEQGSLTRLNSLSLIGGQKEPIRQVVQRMQWVGTEPTADCAADGQGLCTVAMRLEGHVLAIWVVAIADVDSIQKQAIAIQAFLKYAVGTRENYEAFVDSSFGDTDLRDVSDCLRVKDRS